MSHTNSLKDAIERLYVAFSDIPKPRTIDGCPCCIDDKEIDMLLTKPLRDIRPEEMSSYSFSAFLTVGRIADYLYFIPRILEISATDASSYPSPEITGRAIRSSNPSGWTHRQQDALQAILFAIIDNAIFTETYDLIDTWICAIAWMGLNIRLYLSRLQAHPDAVRHYYSYNAESLLNNELGNAFWEDADADARNLVVGWFHSEPVQLILFENEPA